MAISAVNIFYGKRKKNAYIICHLLAYKIKFFVILSSLVREKTATELAVHRQNQQF